MDASQNSGKGQNNQNNEKKPQLSWSQPITPVKPVQTSTPATATVTKNQKNQSPEESHMKRNLIIAAVAILVVAGIAWAVTSDKNSDVEGTPAGTVATSTKPAATGSTSGTTATSNAQASFPSGALVISSPQNAGLTVAVSNITVQVPTWVVIYESYNGQPGNVLGAALFTSDRSSGVVDLLRGTSPGQSYFAGEARDDGDHMFSMINDPAIRDENGTPVTLTFQTK
ncbi:hypothetical protein K2Q08_02475 [Patescibacteria group bacterium]|nr:hypothetical protein [Patescibacteria group bacterium]